MWHSHELLEYYNNSHILPYYMACKYEYCPWYCHIHTYTNFCLTKDIYTITVQLGISNQL